MPDYEGDSFDPPAPVVRVAVRGQGATPAIVPMLIDTGADVSVIPTIAAEAVGAQVHPSTVLVQSYSGDQVLCDQAEMTVEFLRFRFRGRFLVADMEYGILGRNILNSLVLSLDGPRLFWSV